MKKDDRINWKCTMFAVLANLLAISIGLWVANTYLRDIRGVLYDIRTQNEYRELMK